MKWVLQSWLEKPACFVEEDSGPTTTEYAVLFALILLPCVASVGSLGINVSGKFDDAGQGW